MNDIIPPNYKTICSLIRQLPDEYKIKLLEELLPITTPRIYQKTFYTDIIKELL